MAPLCLHLTAQLVDPFGAVLRNEDVTVAKSIIWHRASVIIALASWNRWCQSFVLKKPTEDVEYHWNTMAIMFTLKEHTWKEGILER